MKVALDMRPTSLVGTGIARYATCLAVSLAQEEGVALDLLFKHEVPGDFPAFGHRVQAGVPMWLQAFVPAYCRTAGVEVFHGTNFVLPLLRPCVQVVTVHDLTLLSHASQHTTRNRLITGIQMRLGMHGADAVIVDSEATAAQFRRYFPQHGGRVTVVPLGVAPTMCPASDASIRDAREHYALQRPYVLFLGHLEPRKNLPQLVRAVARCRDRGVWAHDLLLAGRDGPATDEVRREVALLGLEDTVRLIGLVPDALLPGLLSGASAFAYPSLAEGFGLPVLEAMACGTPVMISPDAALREVAEPAARVAASCNADDLADALEHLLTDRAYAQSCREAGLLQAASRSWRETARQTLAVYRRVLQRHEERPRRHLRALT